MPVRSLTATSFFDPEFVMPGCLVVGTLPWVLARCRSRWFPKWLFGRWRGHRRRGRDAWPAEVLTTLVLLRWSETGMSRRGAAQRAVTDVVWRAAMGLAIGGATPSERTLRDFERFLQQRHEDGQVPRYLLLHESIFRACVDASVADASKAVWTMDSTPMWCYGAVRDTVRLLGDGLRMLAGTWARATRCSLAAVSEQWQMPLLIAKSTKGAFAVDWRQATATGEVVTQLAASVVKAVTIIRQNVKSVRPGLRKRLLRKCRHLLRVVGDDLVTNGQGHLVIAERVAADRLVSITDPQARHGRKSKSHSFNGFKIHLLGDVASGLIVSLAVSGGNMHDGVPAHRLVRRAKDLCAEVAQVLADTAYGGARLRHIVQGACAVKLVAPPPARQWQGRHHRQARCRRRSRSTEGDVCQRRDHRQHSPGLVERAQRARAHRGVAQGRLRCMSAHCSLSGEGQERAPNAASSIRERVARRPPSLAQSANQDAVPDTHSVRASRPPSRPSWRPTSALFRTRGRAGAGPRYRSCVESPPACQGPRPT
jgi:hypothetical protein